MRRQHDAVLRCARIFSDYVAGPVDLYPQAGRGKQFFHVGRASAFVEMGRRNFSDTDLLVGRRGSVGPEEFEGVSDARIILKRRGGCLSRKILDEGNHSNT